MLSVCADEEVPAPLPIKTSGLVPLHQRGGYGAVLFSGAILKQSIYDIQRIPRDAWDGTQII